MKRPVRLRLSRAKGFALQRESKRINGLDAVNVARPSRWGNPFRIGPERTRGEAIAMFREALARGELPFGIADVRAELRGKNLACWCPEGEPCHAEVLLRIANART
jgi:hypothetical protein